MFGGGGGGGDPGPTARKQPGQRFLVRSLFYSLQRGSNGFIAEKTILSQGSRGRPTFSRGGGGVQTLLSHPLKPQMSRVAQAAIRECKFEQLNQPPYSPDLGLSSIFEVPLR